MGQYVKLVNVDREEFVNLPGPMKAIERMTNPIAMGMLGFLLLEGPQDGTVFPTRTSGSLVTEAEIDDYIDTERERHADSDHDSVYQNDDGSWQRDSIERTLAASNDIDEANDYAGRWAGDDVRLVGDYAENGLYSAMYGTIVGEVDGQEYTWTGPHPDRLVPCRPGNDCCDNPGHCHSHHPMDDSEAEPGDMIRAPSRSDVDADFAEFVAYQTNEWTNITDGLATEFAEFVGEDWMESVDETGMLSPDMVLNV